MLSYRPSAVASRGRFYNGFGYGGVRPMSKENEMSSLEQEDGADMECGDSETVQMAQVSCCMALEKMKMEDDAAGEDGGRRRMAFGGAMPMKKENEVPSVDGDDEEEPIGDDEEFVLGKRMDDMVETHDEAAAMCKAEGAEWTLCLIDDLMSGQIYFQETMEEEMTITARRGSGRPWLPTPCMRAGIESKKRCRKWCSRKRRTPIEREECGSYADRRRLGGKLQSPDYEQDREEMDRSLDKDIDLFPESYGVWVHDQCEPFAMEMVDDIIEYEAVGMTAEFNAPNEGTQGSTAAIDSDSMLIGAGIGAVVMLLVVGLFATIMKWKKSAAKGQENDMSKVVEAPNVVHVEDDSVEVAKVEGAATVEVVDAEVPTPAGAAVTVAV